MKRWEEVSSKEEPNTRECVPIVVATKLANFSKGTLLGLMRSEEEVFGPAFPSAARALYVGGGDTSRRHYLVCATPNGFYPADSSGRNRPRRGTPVASIILR